MSSSLLFLLLFFLVAFSFASQSVFELVCVKNATAIKQMQNESNIANNSFTIGISPDHFDNDIEFCYIRIALSADEYGFQSNYHCSLTFYLTASSINSSSNSEQNMAMFYATAVNQRLSSIASSYEHNASISMASFASNPVCNANHSMEIITNDTKMVSVLFDIMEYFVADLNIDNAQTSDFSLFPSKLTVVNHNDNQSGASSYSSLQLQVSRYNFTNATETQLKTQQYYAIFDDCLFTNGTFATGNDIELYIIPYVYSSEELMDTIYISVDIQQNCTSLFGSTSDDCCIAGGSVESEDLTYVLYIILALFVAVLFGVIVYVGVTRGGCCPSGNEEDPNAINARSALKIHTEMVRIHNDKTSGLQDW